MLSDQFPDVVPGDLFEFYVPLSSLAQEKRKINLLISKGVEIDGTICSWLNLNGNFHKMLFKHHSLVKMNKVR